MPFSYSPINLRIQGPHPDIFQMKFVSNGAAGLLLISAYKTVCGLQDGKCRLRLPSCGKKPEVQQDISALTGVYRRH